jgi:hypothetical protein
LPATLLLQESVEDPEPPVVVVALRVQMRLVEFVVAASVALALKPFTGVMEILDVPAVLTMTEIVVGLAVSLKS